MNAGQQAAHTTRIGQLESAMIDLADSTANRFDAIDGAAHAERLRLDTQRAEDFARLDTFGINVLEMIAQVDTRAGLTDAALSRFVGLGFWARLRWLVTGRWS